MNIAILAGGKSSRIGMDKGLIVGRRFAEILLSLKIATSSSFVGLRL